MQFLYPSFLWALLALAIPIIIHLFHFRRFKKVYFSNVRFLKEIKEETASRNKLKHLLALLMRMAAVVFLVLAFAQPFIPRNAEVKQGEKAVSIFIDNSFSMSSLSADVPLLEKAKQRAREIVAAYPEDDRFQIITNDFEGRHQRLVGKDDALGFIEEVQISPSVKDLAKVVARQKQTLNNSTIENKVLFLISDFQKNITDLQPETDSLFDLNLVPLQSVQQKNIGIDSAWFEAPAQIINQNNRLMVKVKNYSAQSVENVRLSLRQQGQTKPIGTLTLPPGAEVVDTVNVSVTRAGWQEALLEITDYPVQFDDSYYFTFNVPKQINVLVVNEGGPNAFLNAVLKTSPAFNALNQNMGQLDYSSLPKYRLIVLNDLKSISSGLAFELSQYVKNGGNLLVFPDAQANVGSYNAFLGGLPASQLGAFDQSAREVGQINTEDFIFQDVYENNRSNLKLPTTKGNFRLMANAPENPLLTYRDGQSFLGKYRLGQGNFYLCAAPLNEGLSDLVRNAEVFVPMLFKMALSSGKEWKIAYGIGKDQVMETDNALGGSEMVYKMKGRDEEFIPGQKNLGMRMLLNVGDQVKEAGYYDLYLKPDDIIEKFAFNYDRRESNLGCYTSDELAEKLGAKTNILEGTSNADLGQLVGERDRGVALWKWCLALALLFLLLETAVLRLWR
jgi:hypothetical protein